MRLSDGGTLAVVICVVMAVAVALVVDHAHEKREQEIESP